VEYTRAQVVIEIIAEVFEVGTEMNGSILMDHEVFLLSNHDRTRVESRPSGRTSGIN
jgi:hypothetical protein